ncbi:small RNA 2'-O-methyltransferase isoform X1 [Amia ocellicauda]|uniref:small RNA 2'-O-methyltransferase isoform X1 n=1 Tax=Amia ocellicauda TaxID=2972642 RepID=UPI003464A643
MESGKFCPPLYLQRYQFVIDFVNKYNPKKLADLGCADCSLLRKLKFHRCIELLAGVDIDSVALREKMYTLAPLSCDYLQPSDRPLTIKLYEGSVLEKESHIKGFDLVTCIELIEHLQLPEIGKFSEVLFGYMSPAAVIVSTPNAEFNALLPGLTGFRHQDHKFEWTQAEFQKWALDVCRSHGYAVEFTGVGEAPFSTENRGFCTQIAVFHKTFGSDKQLGTDPEEELHAYKLVYDVEYPSLCDHKIFRNILVNEVIYCAGTIKTRLLESSEDKETLPHVCLASINTSGSKEPLLMDMGTDNEPYLEGNAIYIPLAKLLSFPKVHRLCKSLLRLKEVLLETSQVTLSSDAESLQLLADSVDGCDLEDWEGCGDAENNETSGSSAAYEEDWDEELLRQSFQS